jgi:Fibronectin type III domain
VKNIFFAILLGAVLIAPSFVQAGGITKAPTLMSSTVTLSWDKSSDTGVKGYRLHFRPTPGGNCSRLVEVGNATTCTLSDLKRGQTYYCVVTAYNAAGKESPPSNEISFTVSPSTGSSKSASTKQQR